MIGMDPTAESSAGSLLASLHTDVIQTWINVTKLHFFEGFKKKIKERKPEMIPLPWKRCSVLHFALLHKSERSNQNDVIVI